MPSAPRPPSPRPSWPAAATTCWLSRPTAPPPTTTWCASSPIQAIRSLDTHETVDDDHGRLEHRRASVCHAVSWLASDRRHPHEPHMAHLAMIGMVETQVERADRTERERRDCLASAKLDAKTFAAAVRAHRHVENRLHWVLDVVFHNDLVRLRTGSGPRNMAVVRHMAMNLVRAPHDRHSLKVRRKLANLNPGYLAALVRQNSKTPPST